MTNKKKTKKRDCIKHTDRGKDYQAKNQTDMIDFEVGKAGIQKILNSHFASLHGYSDIYIIMGSGSKWAEYVFK